MYTILIVDDEKIERNGMKFLLKREAEEFQILEASNGREALGILEKQKADILLTDIKMPYMSGLELARQVSEKHPAMKMIMFSGYSDFSYAQSAIRYGVSDYILKPVDPGEFSRTIQKAVGEINGQRKEQMIQTRQQDYLQRFFLQNYLYTGKIEGEGQWNTEEWEPYHYMVLAETSSSFFEVEEEIFREKLKAEIHRNFYYLNLNAGESLFFFREKSSDYELLCRQLYQFFGQNYEAQCCFAVSKEIQNFQEFPQVFAGLEQLLEEQFYQPGKHIFSLEAQEKEQQDISSLQDSELLKKILEDIHNKDMLHLKKHFRTLREVYHPEKSYSEMYVKFLFSSIVKGIYEVMDLPDEKKLSREIDRLYRCRHLKDVLDITEKAVGDLEGFLAENTKGTRSEVTKVKNYIYENYQEDLSIDMLAEMVYLSPGYLSSIFKQETGMNLNRFIKGYRMDKARELLEYSPKKISQIAREVGFSNNSYFCRSFREHFGMTPEACRKGLGKDEEAAAEI